MHVLIIFSGSGNDFIGPFPTEASAIDYAERAKKDYGTPLKYAVQPLVVPYLVRQILYRDGYVQHR